MFEFSVIMAVYNTEEFLRDALESLEHQTYGFEKIQIILVDDGSTDGSGKICDAYAAKYPENVIALHKPNGGQSSARNLGLNYATGKWLNFLDSDDKMEADVFEKVAAFLKKHGEETDVVAIPIRFFGGREGEHILNFRFRNGTRIVDLKREWQCAQLSLAASFIRAEAAEQYAFNRDSQLIVAEDAREITSILWHRQTVGLVADCYYLYRKWGGSTLDKAALKKEYYINHAQNFYLWLIEHAKKETGEVPKFVSYVIMYDMQWRLKFQKIPAGVLTESEQEEYLRLLHETLVNVPDDVIQQARNISVERKLFAYALKYPKAENRYELKAQENSLEVWIGGEKRFNLEDGGCSLDFWNLQKDICTLEGTFNTLISLDENASVLAWDGQKEYPAVFVGEPVSSYALGHEVMRRHHFTIMIPLDGVREKKIFLKLRVNGNETTLTGLGTGRFFPLTGALSNSYFVDGDWCLHWLEEKRALHLTRKRFGEGVCSEIALDRQLWQLNEEGFRKAIPARWAAMLGKALKRKPLWLISDRATKADDNGEAFFRFMQSHPEIDTRFVLSAESEDFARMKKIGKVVSRFSFHHKVLSLMSDYIVSSQAEPEIFNPFVGHSAPYRDMLTQNHFVFLQHGVTKDDISNWMCRRNKNLAGFVTAAYPEYNSILRGDYDYTEKQVWLTGFPRFDRREDHKEKTIYIMPTWRKYLLDHWDKDTDTWVAKPGLEKSDYVVFYKKLLNSEKLFAAARKYGYKIVFFPHPTFQAFLNKFGGHRDLVVATKFTSYNEVYSKASLVVTDYSSAVFDMVYMYKPVLYTQFDKEKFFHGEHVYTKGYFDYERDGFGEVEYDLDSTVDRIIEYMANDCQLKEKYRKRIDNFFAFHDKNNCQRVYEKIMENAANSERKRKA